MQTNEYVLEEALDLLQGVAALAPLPPAAGAEILDFLAATKQKFPELRLLPPLTIIDAWLNFRRVREHGS